MTESLSIAQGSWEHLAAEDREIVSIARGYLDEAIAPIVNQCERERRFPFELIPGLIAHGYVGGVLTSPNGELTLTHLQRSLLMEEAGRTWGSLRTTVNILTLVAELLDHHADSAQQREYLEPLLRGERRGWFGITEYGAGSDAGSVETTASRTAGGYRLRGGKAYITNASTADFGIVMARTGPDPRSALTAFLVENSAPGVEIHEHPRLSVRGTSSCSVALDVVVPDGAVLGELGSGLRMAMSAVNGGRLNVAAGATGLMQACLERAVSHARERKQFGKRIGEFQLVQEMIVGMALSAQAGRLLYQHAAKALDAGLDARTDCSMAKLYCTEHAVKASSDCVQVHGASGLEEGAAPERYFRDAREGTIPEGTSQMQILNIGRAVLGLSAVR